MSLDRKSLGQDPRFDLFLHAVVGDDVRGDSVTVLSMLARLGVDPWREAEALAAMPAAAARPRLAGLMARFSDVPSAVQAHVDVVSALLTYLPRDAADGGEEASPATPGVGPAMYWLVGLLLVLLLLAALGDGP